ncbi:hypothetical protein NM208_g14476 [Fusarium decemcellulare]|uniref:Uncharacterized protein n=1 Tax=Fusarium decemcellulare TaxID=57161 RepID=A0ACC1RFY3_9HYPO|nr:hypothetical protein NM208_g14476 [Fusarium decemcellulare]
MLLPSKGEDEDLVKKYVDNLKGEKYVERFDEVHGWMSARAKLDQERQRKEYERGYRLFLNWLARYL